MKQFAKLNVEDRKLSLIQDSLADAINPLLKLPLSDSNLLQGLSLVSGTNIINHGLGRNLIGWIVTRNNANVTFYDTQAINTTPSLTLTLTASGAATIDLVVF